VIARSKGVPVVMVICKRVVVYGQIQAEAREKLS
jgi:hypothetical protein